MRRNRSVWKLHLLALPAAPVEKIDDAIKAQQMTLIRHSDFASKSKVVVDTRYTTIDDIKLSDQSIEFSFSNHVNIRSFRLSCSHCVLHYNVARSHDLAF